MNQIINIGMSLSLVASTVLLNGCSDDITEIVNAETELNGISGSEVNQIQGNAKVLLHYIDDNGGIVFTLEETTSDQNGSFTFPTIAGIPDTHLLYEVEAPTGSLFGFLTSSPTTVDEVSTGVYDIVRDIVRTPDGSGVEDYTFEEIKRLVTAAEVSLTNAGTDITDPVAVKSQLLVDLGALVADLSEGIIAITVLENPVLIDPANVETVGGASVDLNDGNNELWDIRSDGEISDGTNDSYDGAFLLSIDNVGFPSQTATIIEDDREVVFGPAVLSGLDVSRKIYVDDAVSDVSFARFSEVLTNNTASSITVTVNLSGNLGSDESNTFVYKTSANNTTLVDGDAWFVNHQDLSDPAVGFYFPGADTVIKEDDNYSYTYSSITIEPLSTVVIFHWGFQKTGGFPEAAEAIASQVPNNISNIPAEYFKGLSQVEVTNTLFLLNGPAIIGESGSVAPLADVSITNTNTAELISLTAGSDGGFFLQLASTGFSSGDTLSVTASDGTDNSVVVP